MTSTTPPHAPALAAALVLALAAAPTPLAAQQGPPAAEPEPIEAGLPAEPGRYDHGWDALHYEVELGLSATEAWIGGRARIRLRAGEGARAPLRLDFTGLAVDEVTVDGVPADIAHDDGILAISLAEVPLAGGEIDVEVRYRGVPDDGLILRENVHGEPAAFIDNWPNRARFWLPSIDHPSDKATARFVVHAPEAWEVIANGRLVGQPFPSPPDAPGPSDGARRTWIWTTDVPTPTYTMVVGAADMVIDEVGLAACGRAPASPRPDGCVEVSTWLFPASAEGGRASFRRGAEMVDFFADVVGPYPYEKLAHVQSATRFGGMENSSAIFYSEEAIAAGRDIEGTVSHETAHQWFGDSVTEAEWSHLWLSEGFATYFGAVFFEYADGPEALERRMAGAADAYLSSADTLRPVIDAGAATLFDLLNTNSYQKGAWVLHMLRDVVGDETFFEGVRAYYARFRDGTALTADFRDVIEEVSEQDLGWFFRQWLEQPGYPALEVESAREGGTLTVTVRQVQGDYAPRFRFPLELDLRWSGGERRERVEVTEPTQTFEFEVPAEDIEIDVDPAEKLLERRVG